MGSDNIEVLREAHGELTRWLKGREYSTGYPHVLNARNHLGSALAHLQIEAAALREGGGRD